MLLGDAQGLCHLVQCMAEGKPEHASSEDRRIPEQMGMFLSYQILVLCPSQIAKGWRETRSVCLWAPLHMKNVPSGDGIPNYHRNEVQLISPFQRQINMGLLGGSYG